MMKCVEKANDISIIKVKSFGELIENNNYIGFVSGSANRSRYMVVTQGPASGLAVKPDGTWSLRDAQKDFPLNQYVVFDTAKELYGWLAAGE